MSRIVKSAVVIDPRPVEKLNSAKEASLAELTVIKPHTLSQPAGNSTARQPWKKDSYLEELGKLMIQVDQAKEELRGINRQIEGAKEILDSIPVPVEILGDDKSQEELAKIVLQAQREAETLMEQAAQEAEMLEEQAKERGYQEGFTAGQAEASARFYQENQPKAEKIDDLIRRLSAYEHERMQRDEAEMVRLSIAIAEKIVGRELQTDPSAIKDMLWAEVDRNHREEYIKITLAPDLLPVETQASEEVRSLLQDMGANITVYVDREAVPGTCVVETPVGLTDLTVGTQAANLQESLLSS